MTGFSLKAIHLNGNFNSSKRRPAPDHNVNSRHLDRMPICIECCYPVSELYHVLRSHKSSNNASASSSQRASAHTPRIAETKVKATTVGDVRLTQCPRCKRFADKYVEHDFVVLFIDLVLVKPQVRALFAISSRKFLRDVVETYTQWQVYRHLLFNRLSRDDDEFDPSILRLGILLLLFDVYLTIESLPPKFTTNSPIPTLPILIQYAFYLFYCAATTLSQHLTVRWLASVWKLGGAVADDETSQDTSNTNSGASAAPFPMPPKKPTPNSISTALFVSSCMSLFPILMVVWKYDDASDTSGTTSQSPLNSSTVALTSGLLSSQRGGVDWVRRGVSWAVAVQNLEALRILLGCKYLSAAGLVAAGGIVRWVVKSAILGVVGLEDGG